MKKLCIIWIILLACIFQTIAQAEADDTDYRVTASIVENADGAYSAGVVIINSTGRIECLFAKTFNTRGGAEAAVKAFIQANDSTNETVGNRDQVVISLPTKTAIEVEQGK